MQSELMTPTEAAAYLTDKGYPVSRFTVHRMIKRGDLAFLQTGRNYIVQREELDRWMTPRYATDPEAQASPTPQRKRRSDAIDRIKKRKRKS